jgi:uncharacterized protein
MKILLHSSKTMKPVDTILHALTKAQFYPEAVRLNGYLQKMNEGELAALMQISGPMAAKVKQQVDGWSREKTSSAAVLAFRGDIYSGLAANRWSTQDAQFAQDHLRIMSGLYGVLRPFDGIRPYRLEMGYKLHTETGLDLTKFWENVLVGVLSPRETYLNLTALEYFNAIKQQLDMAVVISPKFMTVSDKTGLPVFVTVHAKIARGSYASWMIRNRIDDPKDLVRYSELNYRYDEVVSTLTQPVFVCQQFGGLGLSVRLS